MTVEIHPVRDSEVRRLAEVTADAYIALPGAHLDDDYLAELRDVARRAREVVVLAALIDGVVVGGVTYVPGPGPYAEFEEPDEAGIRMLAVAPEAQGRGIGTALVAACVQLARASGRRRISLFTTPWMTVAHRIYDAAGFRRAPERDWHYRPDVPLLAYLLDLER